MQPISPASAYLRPPAFAKAEFDAVSRSARVEDPGCCGVLYANVALFDPRASLAFFRDGERGAWDERWVGLGASRTWYLVWSAALGGLPR